MLDLTRCWTELPIAVIDTETTGFAHEDQICEIAVTRFERGAIVAEYASLINPGKPMSPRATEVNGITDAMVAGKPTIEEVAPDLFRICADAIPCAFNAGFDRRFLHKSIQGTDCQAFDPTFPWLDVFVIVSSPLVDKWQKGPGRLKLGACCLRHGVPHEDAHRAFGDTRACGNLLWRLHEKGLVKACNAKRLLEWGAYRRRQQDADHARFRARMDQGAARDDKNG